MILHTHTRLPWQHWVYTLISKNRLFPPHQYIVAHNNIILILLAGGGGGGGEGARVLVTCHLLNSTSC